MFEDEEDISAGYGNSNEMMQQDPMAGGSGDPAAQGGGGGDPLAEGVQAFMETQDPQIAVQVVMMLAEQMGLGGGQPPAGPPAGGGGAPPMPMGRNGMSVPRPRLF